MSVEKLKPKMKSLKSIDVVPLPCVATAKIDGEFNLLIYDKGDSQLTNRWGRRRYVSPAQGELHRALALKGIREAVFLCELYAVDEEEKPVRLDKFLSLAKGKNSDPEALRIAIFDILELDGRKVTESYLWKLDEVTPWLFPADKVHTVPYRLCETREELREFWGRWVTEYGYEGLVCRTDTDTYKVKPIRTVDCVIIGVNKREKLRQKEVTSLKTAVMDDLGNFIELTDVASGITHELRKLLYALLDWKVGEDSETIYVKPFVVVEVEYNETYEAVKRGWKNEYFPKAPEKVEYHSLRHPRLLRFREDKEANPRDVGVDQI